MRARLVSGIGVAVLVALGALATGSFQRREEPGARVLSPSMTSLPSTTPAPREFRALAGVPLTQGTHLRLLVASDPRPFVFDLDRANVQPVAGLTTDGERVVSVLPVGEHAVIVSQRVCTSCRPPAGEVYGLWRRSTTAVRLGTAQEIVAARDGRAVWLLSHRTVNACTLREVGLDGRLRRTRPVSCASKLLGELPAAEMLAANGQLLLTAAEPLAPLTLTNLRSGNSWRLSWPSRLRGGTHIASVHPDGRHIAVGFYGLAAPGEEGYDLWLLDTASRRWRHLPDLPAADIAAKAVDMAWTGDGRLVLLTGTATRGQVVVVWRPGQRRLGIRPVKLPTPSPGTDTLAIW